MKMAIRKMTKKDPTTRLKSLQEFTEFCEVGATENVADSEASASDVTRIAAVKAVLPFWQVFEYFTL